MNEIYWITRFNEINVVALIFLILGGIGSCVSFVYFCDSTINEYKRDIANSKRLLRWFVLITSISCLLKVFVPTEKEALMIWGLGGTIDYVKSNPVAKQIPDKCIIALDKWVDSLAEEKKDSTNNPLCT